GGMNEVSGHRARKLPKRDREQSERKRGICNKDLRRGRGISQLPGVEPNREQRQRAKNNPAFCNDALAVRVEYVRWGDLLPYQDPSGRTQQRHGASYPLTSQIS